MEVAILPKIRKGQKTVKIIKEGKEYFFKGEKAKRLMKLIQEDNQVTLNLFIKYLK